jgi:hypothetical protein
MSKFAVALALLFVAGGIVAARAADDAAIQHCLSASEAGPGKLNFTNTCQTPIRVFYKLHGAPGSKVIDLGPGASRVVNLGSGGNADWAICGPGETAYEGNTNIPWTGEAGTHSCK